jgi:hypothetical protein
MNTYKLAKPSISQRVATVSRQLGMSAISILLLAPTSRAAESPWTLVSNDLASFQSPHNKWKVCDEVKLDPANSRKLSATEGKGILVGDGRGSNLRTTEQYRDCEVELEFMIPKGSNSGVKMNGCYEIQIFDSYKKKKVTGADCGGIYPRGEPKPRYHTIDDGVPPKKNVCRAPGEWQTLKIVFRAPRFDVSGKKIANAKFDRVELNGVVVQEKQEVAYPTGAAWHDEEHDRGPVLLQGDHGPVAFRNMRVKPL